MLRNILNEKQQESYLKNKIRSVIESLTLSEIYEVGATIDGHLEAFHDDFYLKQPWGYLFTRVMNYSFLLLTSPISFLDDLNPFNIKSSLFFKNLVTLTADIRSLLYLGMQHMNIPGMAAENELKYLNYSMDLLINQKNLLEPIKKYIACPGVKPEDSFAFFAIGLMFTKGSSKEFKSNSAIYFKHTLKKLGKLKTLQIDMKKAALAEDETGNLTTCYTQFNTLLDEFSSQAIAILHRWLNTAADKLKTFDEFIQFYKGLHVSLHTIPTEDSETVKTMKIYQLISADIGILMYQFKDRFMNIKNSFSAAKQKQKEEKETVSVRENKMDVEREDTNRKVQELQSAIAELRRYLQEYNTAKEALKKAYDASPKKFNDINKYLSKKSDEKEINKLISLSEPTPENIQTLYNAKENYRGQIEQMNGYMKRIDALIPTRKAPLTNKNFKELNKLPDRLDPSLDSGSSSPKEEKVKPIAITPKAKKPITKAPAQTLFQSKPPKRVVTYSASQQQSSVVKVTQATPSLKQNINDDKMVDKKKVEPQRLARLNDIYLIYAELEKMLKDIEHFPVSRRSHVNILLRVFLIDCILIDPLGVKGKRSDYRSNGLRELDTILSENKDTNLSDLSENKDTNEMFQLWPAVSGYYEFLKGGPTPTGPLISALKKPRLNLEKAKEGVFKAKPESIERIKKEWNEEQEKLWTKYQSIADISTVLSGKQKLYIKKAIIHFRRTFAEKTGDYQGKQAIPREDLTSTRAFRHP